MFCSKDTDNERLCHAQVMSVELLKIVLDQFSKESWINWPSGAFQLDEKASKGFHAFCPDLLGASTVQVCR